MPGNCSKKPTTQGNLIVDQHQTGRQSRLRQISDRAGSIVEIALMKILCAKLAKRLIAAIAFTAIGSVAHATSARTLDDYDLVIDAGRLDALMDKAEQSLDSSASGKTFDEERSSVHRSTAFRELLVAVHHYNVVSARACRHEPGVAIYCVGPYEPGWLHENVAHPFTNAELRAMLDEATSRIEPFWREFCRRKSLERRDSHFCEIE